MVIRPNFAWAKLEGNVFCIQKPDECSYVSHKTKKLSINLGIYVSNPGYVAAFQELFILFDVAYSGKTFCLIMGQELALPAWTTIFDSLKQMYSKPSLDTEQYHQGLESFVNSSRQDVIQTPAMRRTKLSFKNEGVADTSGNNQGSEAWGHDLEDELEFLRNDILTVKGKIGTQISGEGVPYPSLWSASRCLTTEVEGVKKQVESASKRMKLESGEALKIATAAQVKASTAHSAMMQFELGGMALKSIKSRLAQVESGTMRVLDDGDFLAKQLEAIKRGSRREINQWCHVDKHFPHGFEDVATPLRLD